MKLPLSANQGPDCAWVEDAEFNHVADYLTIKNAQTIAHRVNVHDELVAALAGMLAINDSVTQGQEREYREKFLPMARAALERAKQ